MRLGLILPAETEHIGGVQRFAAELHPALARRVDLHTVSLHPDRGIRYTIPSRLRAIGRGGASLAAAHLREPLDAVLSTYFLPFKLVPGCPMGGFVHDLRLWGLDTPRGRRENRLRPMSLILSFAFRTWDVVFVASPHVAESVRSFVPGTRVEVVGEGLDHLERYRSAAAPAAARDTIVVFASGMAHKRADLGVAVAERLARDLDCQAVVLGGRGTQASERVRVVHGMSDEALVRLLERSRVAIAPTRYEGFGLAAGEAMWFGVPVVHGADCPLHDLVGDGGKAAPPTVEGFVRAARELWTDHERYGARAARRAAAYTWDGTAARMLEVLRGLRGLRGPETR